VSHTFVRVVDLPGGALQAVITKSLVRGHGPAVTLRTALPSGAPFEVIHDVAEEPTNIAWPVIDDMFDTLSPLSVAIAFTQGFKDHLAEVNPDATEDIRAVEATIRATAAALKKVSEE
jgi:hypothetical protein